MAKMVAASQFVPSVTYVRTSERANAGTFGRHLRYCSAIDLRQDCVGLFKMSVMKEGASML
jgi:hypothetical protein